MPESSALPWDSGIFPEERREKPERTSGKTGMTGVVILFFKPLTNDS